MRNTWVGLCDHAGTKNAGQWCITIASYSLQPRQGSMSLLGLSTLPANPMLTAWSSFESQLTNVFQANDYLYEFPQDFVSPTLRYNNELGSEEHLKCACECEEKMAEKHMTLLQGNFSFFGHSWISIVVTIHLKLVLWYFYILEKWRVYEGQHLIGLEHLYKDFLKDVINLPISTFPSFPWSFGGKISFPFEILDPKWKSYFSVSDKKGEGIWCIQ